MPSEQEHWQRYSGIIMMRACISCQHYEQIGWDNDEHCPYQDWWKKTKQNGRVQYGNCQLNGNEVFCTEICPQYLQEPGIETVEKPNRPAARQQCQPQLV